MTASGSTAQANAMTRFVAAYGKVCAGQNLNYTASGSGAVDAISSVEAPAPE